jgi:pimeloyl-ACP methyl ester carboxylesterase
MGKACPSDYGVEFESVKIVNPEGIQLHGWWVPQLNPDSLHLLYCHGNAAVLSDLAHVAKIFYDWGFSVLFVDYRCYGLSQSGKLSEEGLVEDAIAGYDWLVQKTGKSVDVVWGHSLGSSIAANVATQRSVPSLILEAPFESIASMAKQRFPWLPIFPQLIPNQFATGLYVKNYKINTKTLVIHGVTDSVVPYNQGEKVFSLIDKDKQFISIPSMDHSEFPDLAPLYKDQILSWLKDKP